jgi:hypothetical protein
LLGLALEVEVEHADQVLSRVEVEAGGAEGADAVIYPRRLSQSNAIADRC